MKKHINILLAALFALTSVQASARGRIQNEDVKSSAEVVAAGGTNANLINDTKIYVTANSINQQLSAAITSGLIGGAGGVNFLSNGNFEAGGTANWSTFTTTMTGVLPTGTIGTCTSCSVSTFTTDSSTPLDGAISLRTQSSGAWAAGSGFISAASTVATAYQAKVVQIKGFYSVLSGGANLNLSGTSSNTFAMYVYDVTNAAWIQPQGVYNLVQSSGVGQVAGTFQIPSNTTSIRLAVVAVNASGGAVSLDWDDFVVGPQPQSIAPSMSDFSSCTPTITGFGTPTSVNCKYRRIGDSIEEFVSFVAGTSTAVQAQVSVPGTIDTSKTGITAVVGEVGQGAVSTASMIAIAPTSNQTYFNIGIQTGSNAGLTAANGSSIIGTGNSLALHVIVPIVGLSSNSVSSADTDTRVVSFAATGTSSQSIGTGTAVQVTSWTPTVDTHGGWSSGGQTYTIPVAGNYRIKWNSYFSSVAVASVGTIQSRTLINGTLTTNEFSSAGPTTAMLRGGSSTVSLALKAGDVVQFTVFQDTSTTLTLQGGGMYATIDRISGPAVVQATESVNARYFSSVSSVGTSGSRNTVTYATKDYDSHNAYSGGTYTIPVSGKYLITASTYQTAATTAANQAVAMSINKNGSAMAAGLTYFTSSASKPISYTVMDQINCVAGDTIVITAGNDGTTPSISASNNNNVFTITRVGN